MLWIIIIDDYIIVSSLWTRYDYHEFLVTSKRSCSNHSLVTFISLYCSQSIETIYRVIMAYTFNCNVTFFLLYYVFYRGLTISSER